MSAGARAAMRHRCTIERDAGGTDSHGADLDSNWQPHLTAQACHAFYTSSSQQLQPQQTESVETLKLLLPIGTDVRSHGDRVATITDRLGGTLYQGPLTIFGPIVRRADHLLLTLRQVS